MVTPRRRVRLPSAPTRKALIMWVPPSLAYRYWLFFVSPISVVCAPVECAACAKASVSAPSLSTENVEIESLAAFAVNAKRPSFVTATQQAAACVVGTDLLIAVRVPSFESSYEDAAEIGAAPAASDTTRSPCRPNAKPNGVIPDEA